MHQLQFTQAAVLLIGHSKMEDTLVTRLSLLASIFAAPAWADAQEYGHMMDWGYGYGVGMMFGPVLWIIVLGLVVAAVIWFFRQVDGERRHTSGRSRALEELDVRLARGEIDAEDYTARKKLLGG